MKENNLSLAMPTIIGWPGCYDPTSAADLSRNSGANKSLIERIDKGDDASWRSLKNALDAGGHRP